MGYWIQVNNRRNEDVVELNRLSVFLNAPNGKILIEEVVWRTG